jgi:hypothetical protein
MKVSLLTFLIFFSCLSFGLAQKKYIAKIQTLEGKWNNGILMRVDSNGIYLLPKKIGWNRKKLTVNIKRAIFFNFREIKNLKFKIKKVEIKGRLLEPR